MLNEFSAAAAGLKQYRLRHGRVRTETMVLLSRTLFRQIVVLGHRRRPGQTDGSSQRRQRSLVHAQPATRRDGLFGAVARSVLGAQTRSRRQKVEQEEERSVDRRRAGQGRLVLLVIPAQAGMTETNHSSFKSRSYFGIVPKSQSASLRAIRSGWQCRLLRGG
jgi:hypothetical protein